MKRIGRVTGYGFLVSLLLLGLLLIQNYVAFKFPIKQDVFGHRYRSNLGNRIMAYIYLLRSDEKFSQWESGTLDKIIEETAAIYGVDPDLVKAITLYESYYLPHAISTTGAMGLMALMPETAKSLGVRDPFDPKENIDAGVRYLSMLSETFNDDVALILAAYNAGLMNVMRYGGVPPFAETMAYVHHVGRIYSYFRMGQEAPAMGSVGAGPARTPRAIANSR
jgi:hypothetical protein